MGADLLVATLGSKFTNKKGWKTDMLKRLDKAEKGVRAWKSLKSVRAEFRGEVENCTIDEDEEMTLEDCQNIALEAIADVRAAVAHGSRDVTITEGGRTKGGKPVALWMTGGMSWGDAPTDSFYAFQRIMIMGTFPDARDE